MIKYYGAGVLYNVIDRAIQAHGSLGFSTDLPLEHMYRAARAARIYDGPDEVHKVTVARQVLKRYTPADVPTEHVPTRREAARKKFADLLVEAQRQRLTSAPAGQRVSRRRSAGSAVSEPKESSARRTPAITDDPERSTGPASSTVPKRSRSSSRTTRPSSRARAAPRQKWVPKPKEMWGFGWRPTSKASAVGPKTASSRLAEA